MQQHHLDKRSHKPDSKQAQQQKISIAAGCPSKAQTVAKNKEQEHRYTAIAPQQIRLCSHCCMLLQNIPVRQLHRPAQYGAWRLYKMCFVSEHQGVRAAQLMVGKTMCRRLCSQGEPVTAQQMSR